MQWPLRSRSHFDCADPDRVASFWAAALGYKKQDPSPGFDIWQDFLAAQGVPESEWNSRSAVVDPAGVGPRLFFQQVPDSKATKNRVHLDLNVGGGLGAPIEERRARIKQSVARLVGLDGISMREFSERDEFWVVMQDPAGNEFCLQ